MKFANFLNKLILIEKLIRQKRTGTPNELARRLSVSRGTLYNIIEVLETHGASIKFSRTDKTFHYDDSAVVNIFFEIKLEEMSKEEMQNTNGGSKMFSSFLLPYNFF